MLRRPGEFKLPAPCFERYSSQNILPRFLLLPQFAGRTLGKTERFVPRDVTRRTIQRYAGAPMFCASVWMGRADPVGILSLFDRVWAATESIDLRASRPWPCPPPARRRLAVS